MAACRQACLIVLLIAGIYPALAAASVTAARVGLTPERTRLVVESDIPINYRLFSLEHPSRLVLDLNNVRLDETLRALIKTIPRQHAYIKRIRVGRPFGEVARVVLDLKAPVQPHIFRLTPMERYGHRLVLDVYPERRQVVKDSERTALERVEPEEPPPEPPVVVTSVEPRTPPVSDDEPEFLLLEVRLDRHVLSDAIPAYQRGEHTLLPLGELARLLTLAIQTQPEEGTASGYVIGVERSFSLSLPQERVTVAGEADSFDPRLAMAEPDDLYVSAELLQRWLPLDLDVNRSTLVLGVLPREPLPLQARLERERLAERLEARSTYEDPGYPEQPIPYRTFSMPFIDQTLGMEIRNSEAGTTTRAGYSGFLTGDFLGAEAELFVGADSETSDTNMRLSFGRHDMDSDLLGPLQARSWEIGSLTAPSVPNLTRPRAGEGATVSNRPLRRPSSFDRQTFEGDLPPGWDVELYYNDALVGFQTTGADGRYRFEDQPLLYGRNDFELVFHGPLGQVRVERHSFSLDSQMVRPGEFYYDLTQHRDDDGYSRTVAQFDWGIDRRLAATGGFVQVPVNGSEQQFANLGLRSFWRSVIVSGDFYRAEDGGALAEVGLKTGFAGISIDLRHLQFDDFVSEEFWSNNDLLRVRDELRLSSAIPLGGRRRLPVSLAINRDEYESGLDALEVLARVSAYVYRTALTQQFDLRSIGDDERLYGNSRASRRLGKLGLSSDINYQLNPDTELTAAAISVDRSLGEGYRLNLGLIRAFITENTLFTAGLTKSLGRFGLAVTTSHSSDGMSAIGTQLFVATGHDPRRGRWIPDALPGANLGAASAQVFVDSNGNSMRDPGEEGISEVGFTVNGGLHQARTDADGLAYLPRLPTRQYVDVGVDTGSLVDPQWLPERPGVRLEPRAGRVAAIDFPVILTSEIDGTVRLVDGSGERGIGDIQLELVDAAGDLVASTTSAWDGFYILEAVPPGEYVLRVSPEQLTRLQLEASEPLTIRVHSDGEFVYGMDFVVKPKK